MIKPITQQDEQPRQGLTSAVAPQQPSVPGIGSTRSMFDSVEEDPDMFLGRPEIAGQPSFRGAVAGIEDGDYQGLEQLDFGAVDGQPAVSFVDEDGQRQVFKLTMPQWAGALEARSRSRRELEQAYKQDAMKRALAPQYRSMLRAVPGAQDPVAMQAWDELYDLDPETAYKLAGASLKKDTPMGVLYGTEQPKPVVDAYQALLGEQYKQRMQALENHRQSTNDTNTLAYIGSVQGMIRPPQASWMPRSMTPSDYANSSGVGMLPLVNVLTMATLPRGLPGMPQPIMAPYPNAKGEYGEQQLQRFATEFNNGVVGPVLGWAPYDMQNEAHRQQVIELLNNYNKIRAGGIDVQAPSPQRQGRPGYIRPGSQEEQPSAQAPRAEMTPTTPVETDIEREVMVYGAELYEMTTGKAPPSDPAQAADVFVQLIMDQYETNRKLRAQNKDPLPSPPPQVIDRIYKAITQEK